MDLLHLGLPYQARHLHRRSKAEFRVRVKDVGEMTLRPRSSDSAVVTQVFSLLQYDLSRFPQGSQVDREYRKILDRGKRPLIVDLGANIGASVRWFAAKYPEAKIVAVEPDADKVVNKTIGTRTAPATAV